MRIAADKRLNSCLLLATVVLLYCPAVNAEAIEFSVKESAGLRRFGYPVTASLQIADGKLADAENARLVDAEGKEIAAQFTAMATWPGGGVKTLDVDFIASPGPHESAKYRVELGKRPTKTANGLEVVEEKDEIVVQSAAIAHRIRRDGKPLLSSIAFGELEFLGRGGATITLPVEEFKVIKRGPFNVTLVAGPVTLEYANSKSWVKIVQRAEAPQDLAVAASFHLPERPILWDFGVGSWLYGTLGEAGDTASLVCNRDGWSVRLGDNEYARGERYEGWGHIADAKRVIAFAAAPSTDSAVHVQGDGACRVETYGREQTVYFHVVGQPVQVTAATSPPSMLAPLVVEVE